MASREQALTALLAVVASTAAFKLTSRRDRAPESIGPAESPALFLVETGEEYRRPAINLPPIRTLRVDAIFYNDVGSSLNAVPLTLINAALDALDVALQPDNRMTGLFTLGGLVNSVTIDGEIQKATGAKTGKAAAIVPLRILLP